MRFFYYGMILLDLSKKNENLKKQEWNKAWKFCGNPQGFKGNSFSWFYKNEGL